MTCIVGYLDLQNDCVWVGGDSCGSNGYTQAIYTQSKVFRNEVFKSAIMGSTCTFRHIDLLKYAELFDKVDFLEDVNVDHKYMVTKFIPKLHTLFKDGIFSEKEEDRGDSFIVGVKNKLFEVQQDYSVLVPRDNFCAVGCGWAVALGSLYSTKDSKMPVQDKVRLALEAAEHVAMGVQRPFKIINTKDYDKEIVVE